MCHNSCFKFHHRPNRICWMQCLHLAHNNQLCSLHSLYPHHIRFGFYQHNYRKLYSHQYMYFCYWFWCHHHLSRLRYKCIQYSRSSNNFCQLPRNGRLLRHSNSYYNLLRFLHSIRCYIWNLLPNRNHHCYYSCLRYKCRRFSQHQFCYRFLSRITRYNTPS